VVNWRIGVVNSIRFAVVVVLPDPFRGMWARKNSAETQQTAGPLRKSGPEIKDGRSSAKDGALERSKWWWGTI